MQKHGVTKVNVQKHNITMISVYRKHGIATIPKTYFTMVNLQKHMVFLQYTNITKFKSMALQ